MPNIYIERRCDTNDKKGIGDLFSCIFDFIQFHILDWQHVGCIKFYSIGTINYYDYVV